MAVDFELMEEWAFDTDLIQKSECLHIINWENIMKPKNEIIQKLVKDLDKSACSSLSRLISGFIRELNEKELKNTHIPFDINDLIINYIPCLIISAGYGTAGYACFNLFWGGYACLPESDKKNIFGFIKITNNGGLGCETFNRQQNKGGKIMIKCLGDFIIDTNSGIDVTGKGYENGHGLKTSGGSYTWGPIENTYTNNDGGGGPGASAGYGTAGAHSWGQGVDGGKIYGDKYISVLHLGSGGGCDRSGHVAGGGGGAIKIETYNLINNGSINANGSCCALTNNGSISGNCCGSGSGGSIHIVTSKLIMEEEGSIIQAVGGDGLASKAGVGRIRIETKEKNIKLSNGVHPQINPTPYIG